MKMNLENVTIYAFLFFIIVAAGFILTTTVTDLDMSSWDFTGDNFLKALIPNFPLIFVGIGAAVVILYARSKKR